MMSDGRLGKCKDCARRDVKQNYQARIDQYRAYEKRRNKERAAYLREHHRLHKKRNPEKTKARQEVTKALKDGRLQRLPCDKCGNLKVQAHHDDYGKPLDVRWLCFVCHRIEHGQFRDKLILGKF